MIPNPGPTFSIAIACGGTGGHLFPGMAVADALWRRGSESFLCVSQKAVDKQAVTSADGFEIVTLPAVALQNRNWFRFLAGFVASLRICMLRFSKRRPDAVIAFGGFTAAPAILAAKCMGSATFLHESNAIPGRSNRILAFLVDEIFVGYEGAVHWFHNRSGVQTGTPVRPQFKPLAPAACRIALGLDQKRPVMLVMGGSQGAAPVNQLVLGALPILKKRLPDVQYLHLTGLTEKEAVAAAYREHGVRAIVLPFLTEMELALGAATVAVSRAGASSLAEFAAMRLPSILIPYPRAMDNHQYYNARALMNAGAARQMDQRSATPETLVRHAVEILENRVVHEQMRQATGGGYSPNAADEIAQRILRILLKGDPMPVPKGAAESEPESTARAPSDEAVVQPAPQS
ncbi:MAG: UDP-N-acetylglucosamine--N-acetylmuramyl-(pentapeptide) pyrophosphoryl-undecaprenol N-acetylglucosamine transferase [Verrucomicrobia bacterium]|nr:UDP-N-acetylglucosamine--N-acetylmuramyl-(pentapeptide) pyrophosphoryl-undecaprenol N-acetylglucosamine transferase [Verrucomicrobiota bacterium]